AHQQLVETLLGTLTDSQNAEELAENWARISEHFDTLFTTEASVDALKQTILQLAVMGKLVPQDPNDEPASELLKRIAQEKAQLVKEGKIKKQKPLPPISDEEKPFELPEGWEWCKFGLTSEFINGDRGSNYPNKNEYVSQGIPWINTGHIEKNGTLTVTEMNFITEGKFNELRSGKIQKGDLVYCLRGATFGKTAFVIPYETGAIASSLMIIRPFITEMGGYIYNYLTSPFGRSQIYRFDNGSAQPNLSANSVMLYSFPCPPLTEQYRIFSQVGLLHELCDKLKTRIKTAQQTQLHLADALTDAAIN
ncbi:restriction endonuclease subunit S, partial [Escherichia coli]